MLLFIHPFLSGSRKAFLISIHLMLLFIQGGEITGSLETDFNTSHVTVYRKFRKSIRFTNKISIHLMLLFIVFVRINTIFIFHISIHLMLLFIELSFATSTLCDCISIHLMLLFIKTSFYPCSTS